MTSAANAGDGPPRTRSLDGRRFPRSERSRFSAVPAPRSGERLAHAMPFPDRSIRARALAGTRIRDARRRAPMMDGPQTDVFPGERHRRPSVASRPPFPAPSSVRPFVRPFTPSADDPTTFSIPFGSTYHSLPHPAPLVRRPHDFYLVRSGSRPDALSADVVPHPIEE